MLHVMIDIETFGVKPWSVVRSIGAVSFDPSDPSDTFPHQFYVNVSRSSCEEHGMTCEQRVVDWWAGQSAAAQAAFASDQVSLPAALESLTEWFNRTGAKNVWSQGAAFDFPILDTAYQFALEGRPPWHFRAVRDTRTAYQVLGFDYDSFDRAGVAHDALDDCRHQVAALKHALHGRHR